MVADFQVETKETDFLGCVSEGIDITHFGCWDNELVITGRSGKYLEFDKGDFRVEIDKDKAIRLAKAILHHYDNL